MLTSFIDCAGFFVTPVELLFPCDDKLFSKFLLVTFSFFMLSSSNYNNIMHIPTINDKKHKPIAP